MQWNLTLSDPWQRRLWQYALPLWLGVVALAILANNSFLLRCQWRVILDWLALGGQVIIMTGFGRTLSRILRTEFAQPGERLLIAVGLGFVGYSFAILLVGLAGFLTLGGILAILLLFTLAGLPGIFWAAHDARTFWTRFYRYLRAHWWPTTTVWQKVVILILLITLVLGAFRTMTPPLSRDELIAHLAIPKIYIAQHGIVEIPFMIFAYYPLGFDMFYAAAMLLSSDIQARLYHFVFFLFSLALLACMARRLGLRRSGYAVAIYAAMPIVFNTASQAYVDHGLIFYLLLAMLLIFEWRNQQNNERLIWLAAVMTGFSICIKFNGFLLAFLLLMLIGWFSQKKQMSNRAALRLMLIFGLIVLMLPAPWFAKTYRERGNPFYPRFASLFPHAPKFAAGGEDMNRFLFRKIAYHYTLLDEALIPVTLATTMTSSWIPVKDGIAGPLFLLTLPALLLIRRKPADFRLLLLFSLLYYLLAYFLEAIRIRYYLPIFPFLALMTGWVWQFFERHASKNKSFGFLLGTNIIGLLILVLINLNLVVEAAPIHYLSGLESRSEYLLKRFKYYSVFQYINQQLAPDSKTLLVYTNMSYYCDRPYIYDSYHSGFTLRTILKESRTPEEARDQLRRLGITHIFLDHTFLDEDFTSANVATERFRSFAQQFLEPLVKSGNTILYQLR